MLATADAVVPEVAVPEDESDGEYQVISKKPKIAEAPAPVPATTQTEPTHEPVVDSSTAVADAGEAMEDIQEASAAEQGPVSDAEWLRSRTNRVLELVEDDEEVPSTAPVTAVKAPTAQIHVAVQPQPQAVDETSNSELQQLEVEQVVDATSSEEDKIRETGRLYLRNLHFEISEDELREQFSKHGPLEEVSKMSSHSFLQIRHPMMKIGRAHV